MFQRKLNQSKQTTVNKQALEGLGKFQKTISAPKVFLLSGFCLFFSRPSSFSLTFLLILKIVLFAFRSTSLTFGVFLYYFLFVFSFVYSYIFDHKPIQIMFFLVQSYPCFEAYFVSGPMLKFCSVSGF